MNLPSLPRLLIEPVVRTALIEDLGLAGDITSNAVIPAQHHARVVMTARKAGIIAGLDAAELSFHVLDPAVLFVRNVEDGAAVKPGDVIATIEGRSRSLLAAERTALNFVSHLSGIATVTAQIAEAISDTRASVVCTRKTTPGLRTLEKHAVLAGGGKNHRFALHDAVLIKDNHIAITGSVAHAIRLAKANVGHLVKVEVEVDTLDQLREALEVGVDAILLDNMTPDQLRDAVTIVASRAVTEASGNITPATASEIARSGVDLLSVGWITHSAPILDIGLDFVAHDPDQG